MGAILFINVHHFVGKGKNVHRTKGNAGSATKTPVFENSEPMGGNSAHDPWKDSMFKETSFSKRHVQTVLVVKNKSGSKPPYFHWTGFL